MLFRELDASIGRHFRSPFVICISKIFFIYFIIREELFFSSQLRPCSGEPGLKATRSLPDLASPVAVFTPIKWK